MATNSGCRWFFMSMILSVMVMGCSMVSTKMYDGRENSKINVDHQPEGLSYYLPKKKVQVTITRQLITAEKVKKAKEQLDKAETALKEAKKEEEEAKKAADFAEELVKITAEPGKAEAQKLAALRNAEHTAKTTATAKAGKAQTKAKDELQSISNQEEMVMRFAELERAELITNAQIQSLRSKINFNKDLKKDTTDLEKELDRLWQLDVKLKKAAEDAKNVALGSQGLGLGGGAIGPPFEDSITLTPLPMKPDTSRMFFATLNHYGTHADNLTLKTTEEGLLTSGVGTKTDKLGDILIDTAKLAKTIAQLVAAPFPIPSSGISNLMEDSPQEQPQAAPPPNICPELLGDEKEINLIRLRPFQAEYVFDPTEFNDVKTVNKALCSLGTPFIVVTKPESSAVSLESSLEAITKKKINGPYTQEQKDTIDGLVYRRALPYVLEIRERHTVASKKNEDDESTLKNLFERISFAKKSTQIMLPNKAPLSVLPMDTGIFTATKHEMEFKEGMLTTFTTDRPSEMHGFIQIPLTIAKDLLSLPAEIFQLKIDWSSKETNLLQQQKALLEAQAELKKAVEEIGKGTEPSTESTDTLVGTQ